MIIKPSYLQKKFFPSGWLVALHNFLPNPAGCKVYRVNETVAQLIEITQSDVLSENDVLQIEALILQLEARFIEAFGAENITINFHRLKHLPDQIREFGPPIYFTVSCDPYDRFINVFGCLQCESIIIVNSIYLSSCPY
jgi:hypothetical protein